MGVFFALFSRCCNVHCLHASDEFHQTPANGLYWQHAFAGVIMNHDYGRLVSRAALAATLVATLLLIIKIFAWWYTGSVSILAALVDSLVDIAASLTNLLVVRYSLQPADEEHTFGHGKAESLAALAQSMFISGSALFLFLTGIQHLITPEPMRAPLVGIVVTVAALITTLMLVTFQRWVVRKTRSQAVRADMLHYQSDVMMNGAILVALALSWYGLHRADALFALGIGVWILYSALRMGYEAIQSLLDRALPDDERQAIVDIVAAWPGVRGAHDLRTRQSGPTRFIQLHLEMEDNLPLVQAHLIAEQVEQAILSRFPGSDVIIHQDPCSVVPRFQQGQFEH
ncbi:Cobalt-zinc-cadmium resistance protein [Cronobacter sakazakii 680]|nr:Cobalt-zinc-cadmium resistance protein [Cronobacter sakazakii 680]